ncbi:RISC-loading complex subunit tarbp2-like isoform X2 [Lineus longissimus]|uniref:RISC-loading complex subunit tarbp2-like isoform X2 n=1 Tax=Lineus longissimus TaxID=88925 RepID=UPI00315CB422
MSHKGPGKTPIALLYEVCSKLHNAQPNMKPHYEEVEVKGQVHDPVYVFKCSVGDLHAMGQGTKKKQAKHQAAHGVLQKMDDGSGRCVVPGLPGQNSIMLNLSQIGDDGSDGNPVGQLQELTQEWKWVPPTYEFSETVPNKGQPAKEFTCTLKLGKTLQERGIGKSKKSAKRKAAQAMLQQIKAGATVCAEDMEPEDFDHLHDSKGSYTALKEGKRIPTITPGASKEIGKFYAKMKNATGPILNALHTKPVTTPAANYCQMLQQLAEEQRFEVTYVDLQDPAPIGQHGQRQCLVQLSTMPVAVCHGFGPTTDDSHAQAAHTALQYLKIMTKKA